MEYYNHFLLDKEKDEGKDNYRNVEKKYCSNLVVVVMVVVVVVLGGQWWWCRKAMECGGIEGENRNERMVFVLKGKQEICMCLILLMMQKCTGSCLT